MSLRVLRASLVLYIAVLLAPTGTVLVDPTPAVFVGSTVVGLGIGVVLTGGERIDSWFAGWLAIPLALLPAGWLIGLVPSLSPGAAWPLVAGTTAVIPGLIAAGMTYEIRNRRRLDELTTYATFTARQSPKTRRQLNIAGVALLFATVVAAVVFTLLGDGLQDITDFIWLPTTMPLWIIIIMSNNEREVAVTDDGLRIQQTLHEWETFSGYECSDDALTINRDSWYGSTFSFDVSDIEDVDTVVKALDRQLPVA